MGAQMVREVASKSSDLCRDGTTTTNDRQAVGAGDRENKGKNALSLSGRA